MDELTELEKEIFDAMIGRPFGSSKVYDNPQIIRQAKAAASLCREKCKEAWNEASAKQKKMCCDLFEFGRNPNDAGTPKFLL